MLSFVMVLLTTIVFSFLPERLLKPTAPKLTANNILLQSLLVTMLFLLITLIVQRPVFSGLAVFIFLIILIAVSNAKFMALREPMVFSDFAMFAQAFKHPRLYFPFLGLAPVIIAPILIIGLIYLVLTLEPALPFTWQRILGTLVVIVVAFFTSKKLALHLKLTENPEQDNEAYGLQNSLYAYTLQAGTEKHKTKIIQTLKASPFSLKNKTEDTPPPLFTIFIRPSDRRRSTPTLSRSRSASIFSEKNAKPNITVIQSESFFDARRLHPSIKTDILKNFDACNATSIQYGKLKVPAWGANTMRTEFSFLTGLDFKEMGFYRYYPYQFIDGLPISSIASALQAQGYYCVCIHPHHASFFRRDKVFPQMGFDEFIDIDSFDEAKTIGPYISDQAVTNKILEITKQKTDKPLFIFAITMENHGPLHLEKTTERELETYYSDSQLSELNDLTVYLRHLKNADEMIETLTQEYQESAIPTTLCFYGDHVPSMPKIYQKTAYEDSHSDYFIWHSTAKNKGEQSDINIKNLGVELLRTHR